MPQFYKNLLRISAAFLCSIIMQHASATDFTVTNTNNSGAGSLADAIDQANLNSGADRITFSLPAGVSTINLTSPLPAIYDRLEINGYLQAGTTPGPIASRTILININGAGIGSGDIFTILSSDVTIAGLAIYNSPGYAIRISPSGGAKPVLVYNNIFIWGNYIGTDNTGMTTGIGNKLGGIASNVNYFDINANIIIGTDGNGTDDINEGNLICGSKGDGSGYNGDGIILWKTISSKVAGNFIGLNKNGAGGAAFGNKRFGVLLTVGADNNVIGTDGDNQSDDVEINYICNNDSNGVVIGQSKQNTIAGNNIGLDINWNAAGNQGNGIHLLGSSENVIGTNGDGTSDYQEMNIIGYNDGYGIVISSEYFYGFEANASDNIVAGNAIGTSDDGALVAGNANAGILIYASFGSFGADNNIIGVDYAKPNHAGMTNLIAHNQNGVVIRNPVSGATCTGNKIASNSIFQNTLLGIDLGDDGISSNDNGSGAGKANEKLNAPVITSVSMDGTNSHLTITGFSRPNTVVEFFVADAGPHPLQPGFTKTFGQGQILLFRGQDNATLGTVTDNATDAGTYNGADEGTGFAGTITENKFSFTVPTSSLPVSITGGTNIVAVAYVNTTGAGSTSEFGGNFKFTVTPVTLTSFKGRLNKGKAYLTWTTTNEVNNKQFEVEKSTDGTHFTRIGTVSGLGGVTNTYNFTDENATAATNHYRLKQVDADGQSTLSRVIVLRGDMGDNQVKTTPNPFTSQINVSYQLAAEENLVIRMFDQSGRAVKTYYTTGGAGTNNINLSDVGKLPGGMYILEIKGNTTSVIKQVLKLK